MQAALQPWVDGAISKTIHLPAGFERGALARVFEQAHALGLKGCTVFRAGTARGQVVGAPSGAADDIERCCAVA
jgi:ribonucleoside-diphosphate reductase alpha chain